MTSTMVAHPDQPPEGLALHLGLRPRMMMMKSRSKWRVRTAHIGHIISAIVDPQ